MTVTDYNRGHEIYYDDEKKTWVYKETGERVLDHYCIECVKCDKPPVDDVDFCLYGLHDCDFIQGACCGHNNPENAYILLKDGRRFVLDKMNIFERR